MTRHRVRNPHHHLWTRYGLRPSDKRALLTPGGLCPLCFYRPATDVDHDHNCCPGIGSCGDCIRGVLCGPCNRALDEVLMLVPPERLIAYLAAVPRARALLAALRAARGEQLGLDL